LEGSGSDNSRDLPWEFIRMRLKLKLWSAAGVCLAVAAPVGLVIARDGVGAALDVRSLDQGGEGGEGGGEAGGLVPSQYRLLLDPARAPDYDGASIARAYAADVRRGYAEAQAAAGTLQAAIADLLADPNTASLATARAAWIQARRPYLATEAFRFYDGPIDGPATAARPAGPAGRLNAWPLNVAVIDYVEGLPEAGLVNAFDVVLTAEAILTRDQVSDEADVTTGWHAIEFLLWGQDRRADGPGARPASDYNGGTRPNDRRRR
jgi:putative iron-regulated protein